MKPFREVIVDADDKPYLVRYFLKRFKSGIRWCLHHIVRSDYDRALHCHPWKFTSFILWGGYYEIVDSRMIPDSQKWEWDIYAEGQLIKWFGPFSVLRRPAHWRHRLMLPQGKTAWTIVRMDKKEREWGFWISRDQFCHNKNYSTKTGLCDV